MSIQQSPVSSAIAAPPELGALLDAVKDELELVEKFLNSNLVDDSPFIEELLGQVFKAGGKRLRPALSLLVAKATSNPRGEVNRLHIILAVLTELIHTASLVHDDVIDSASLRRGQETVNRKFSDKLAVLTGDLLFAQASVCLARLMNPPIVGIYGQVLGDLCAGEIRQMRQQFVLNIDWNTYIQKSIWKTASLFAAGTQSAPILNHCKDEVVSAMKQYGLNLGICFQIVDDLLDVTASSSQLGKPAGSDLSQGLITAPTLFVLERKDEAAARLEQLIKTRAVSSAEGIEESLEIIRANGGVESTVNLAHNYARAARETLSVIPASSYRDCLDQMVDWLLTRTN
ncbi:MAG: polyprenyl synthetase family protein [Candidatus Obscuribacterales bacterium]|nr:polyprenyl synthetase family protein [Candidatus Obscuribacterales bacterium]